MSDYVLAIVGSVKFQNPHGFILAGDIIDETLDRLQPIRVVSGGADGIDKQGASAARQRRIEVTEYFPKKRQWAPDGFKERNLLIANDCTHLLRIACRRSTTYGSGWTADRAEELGVIVDRRYIEVDG